MSPHLTHNTCHQSNHTNHNNGHGKTPRHEETPSIGKIEAVSGSGNVPGEKSPESSTDGTPRINTRPVHNRIFEVMMHTTRYAFKAQARLAADCGVAPSTICRLITGQCSPSFAVMATITKALEQQLNKTIDPREIVSLDESFPTASTCELCGCRGCLPDEAYDEHDRLRPAYRGIQPGQWTILSRQFVAQALNEPEGNTRGSRNEKNKNEEGL